MTSLSQGPVMGGMLFGRYIDAKEISQLTEIMDLNFSINNISDLRLQKTGNQIVDSLLLNEQTIIVKINSPNSHRNTNPNTDSKSDPNRNSNSSPIQQHRNISIMH